jgi:hypothetical protein
MTNELFAWANRWGVPFAAIQDLRATLGLDGGHVPPVVGKSEAAVQAAVRLEAAQKGVRLWRNNVGVLKDERGVPVRYGLANDSHAVNKNFKSADLIGIRPLVIQPFHVGHMLGQFVSREIKHPDWKYRGDEREEAQLRWAQMVIALGGDAGFATGEGTL